MINGRKTLSSLIQTKKTLSDHTTMGVGGPADYFAEVQTIDQLREVLLFKKTHNLRHIVIGRGSNALFDDRGFKGLVILNRLSFLEKKDDRTLYVGSGYHFSLIGSQSARWGLSGLEFASGIPGSVGGAIFMNAGANGRETCENLTKVQFMNFDGDLITLQKDQMTFRYRWSCFHELPGIITAATFQLTEHPQARARQLKIIKNRQSTQPLNEKSSGCMFRNPQGDHSGALIEHCGLKGTRVGGAEVSLMHANFIVNTGGATAQNILDLVTLVQKRVKEKTGHDLHMEVRRIPYE